MPLPLVFCVSPATALPDTSKVVLACTGRSAVDANSDVFPTKGTITRVDLEFVGLSGAATCFVALAWDAAGDIPFTPEIPVTIATGKTTTTKGGCSVALGVSGKYKQPDTGVDDTVYVVVRLGAGSSTTCTARVTVER